ncbi:quinone oxidoreductase family protein [Actinomadura gamaensis]|uniref:Zinc-binding alcohol dehydrogenase family protein n=1 Tax=Actinomadura gamaensis TaxID=1763541 RepID=A0ABV9TY40_9ACTN
MRIVRYREYGDPGVLRVEEDERPTPGPGQVAIAVEAVGAQFATTQQRRGIYPGGANPLPGAPGGDVVGTVTSVGAGVTEFSAGDRVAALVLQGAYADHTVADLHWVSPVPDGIDAAAATALASPAPVALGVLRTGRLAEGETVLVHAAAGAIGHLAVQLAVALGAGRVVATAGSAAKRAFAREQGADVVVDYTAEDWDDRVRDAVGEVDLVLDSVGAEVTRRSIGLLAPFGRLVFYGSAAGGREVPQIPLLDLIGLRHVSGFALRVLRERRPELIGAGELAGHLRAGRLRPVVHAELPLEDAVKAHELIEARANTGKIVLVP